MFECLVRGNICMIQADILKVKLYLCCISDGCTNFIRINTCFFVNILMQKLTLIYISFLVQNINLLVQNINQYLTSWPNPSVLFNQACCFVTTSGLILKLYLPRILRHMFQFTLFTYLSDKGIHELRQSFIVNAKMIIKQTMHENS